MAFAFYWLWWRWSNFGARLHAIKLDMTHITSYRNVISIQHTASAVFVYILIKRRAHRTYVTNTRKEFTWKIVSDRWIPFFFLSARDGRNAADPARTLIGFRERGTVPFNCSLLRGRLWARHAILPTWPAQGPSAWEAPVIGWSIL